MAKNRPSFGDAVSNGLQESYTNEKHKPTPPASDPIEEKIDEKESIEAPQTLTGSNKYYNYHPSEGARGGTIGRPRKDSKRIQMSIGCTEEEKQMYMRAASADGRKLPQFVNIAIKEYIVNHGLDKLI